MPSIHVRIHVQAPIERVFEAVSDHVTFLGGGGATCRILRPGTPPPNGLGCLREVVVGDRARYVEEIVGWDPPHQFSYRIRETSLRLQHAGSRLVFTEVAGATTVDWSSRFRVTVPILGGLLGRRAKRLYAGAFLDLLLAAKERIEAAPR